MNTQHSTMVDAGSMTGPASLPPVSIAPVWEGVETAGGSAGDRVAFRILDKVGEGGMGEVYRAEQQFPRRIVALKLIKGGTAGNAARFEREVTALARLRHPGIAAIFTAGKFQSGSASEAGRRFLAMEYVNGLPLTTYAARYALNRAEILKLFIQVCDAVGHAHAQGIVHRDLKPGNILVTDHREVRIIDFGLAQIAVSDELPVTLSGEVLGTLEYASPEQAAGRWTDVNNRSDVYSLGVILYELLAARRWRNFSGTGISEAARMIAETPMPVATRGDPVLKGDMGLILSTAMDPDPERRYATAAQLGDDIRRLLSHKPLLARPPSWLYRTKRFAQRHRLALAAGAILSASILVSGAALSSSRAANHAAALQEQRRLVTVGDTLFSQGKFAEARETYSVALDNFTKLHEPGLPADLGIWETNLRSVPPMGKIASLHEVRDHLTISPDHRYIAGTRPDGLVKVADVAADRVLMTCTSGEHPLAVLFDLPRSALVVCGSNSIEWHNLEDGRLTAKTPVKMASAVNPIIWQGQVCFVAEGGQIGMASPRTQEVAFADTLQTPPVRIGASEDGLVALLKDGRVFRWNAKKEWLQIYTVGEVPRIPELSPDGRSMAYIEADDVVIVDLVQGVPRTRVPRADAREIVYSGPESLLLSGGGLRSVQIARGDHAPDRLWQTQGNPHSLAGCDVGLSAVEGEYTLWWLGDSKVGRVAGGPRSTDSGAAISSDGSVWAVSGGTGRVAIHREHQAREETLDLGGHEARFLGLDPQGQKLAVVTMDHQFQYWDVARGLLLSQFIVPGNSPTAFSMSRDGQSVVIACGGVPQLQYWRLAGSNWEQVELPGNDEVDSVDLTPDGRYCLVGGKTSVALFDRTAPAQPRWRLQMPKANRPRAVAFINAGSRFICNPESTEFEVRYTSRGTLAGKLPALGEPAWSAAGNQGNLVSVSTNTDIYLFDAGTFQLVRRMERPFPGPVRLRDSFDGRKILFSSARHAAVLWDLGCPRIEAGRTFAARQENQQVISTLN